MNNTDLTISPPLRKKWLIAEFTLFYLLVPVGIAIFLPSDSIIPALFVFTVIGLVLLHLTPSFSWGQLHFGWNNWHWRELAAYAASVTLVCMIVIWTTRPDAAFFLLRQRPEFLLVIWLLYPFLSALPQELLYRALFYRRYMDILPRGVAVHLLNAVLFSFAHLVYWSWVVAIMTFIGSLIFSWAYSQRGSFGFAVILHGIAGNIIFAVGLGVFFYLGNVQRPF